jgi:hypothetical protein
MLHAALLLLMLEAAQRGPRFTISLKRSTQNSSAIHKLTADYSIYWRLSGRLSLGSKIPFLAAASPMRRERVHAHSETEFGVVEMRFAFIISTVSTCHLRARSLGQRVFNQTARAARRKFLVVDSDQDEDAYYSLQRS